MSEVPNLPDYEGQPLQLPDGTVEPRAATVREGGSFTPGADLVADLDAHKSAGHLREHLYWVGVVPSCPVQAIDLAGINFPLVNERIVDDPLGGSKRRRVPKVGALVRLTAERIIKMREKLPRLVIRFTDGKPVREEAGTGQNVGDDFQRGRKGHVITIPTAEEVAERRRLGRAAHLYSRQPSDRPAALFMFAHLCEDQENGNRGDSYPPTLDKTGLYWPEELELPEPKKVVVPGDLLS